MITKERIKELRETWHFNEEELVQWWPFEALMTKHVAALADRLGLFVSRMSKRDRELVTENALWYAWTYREDLGARFIEACKADEKPRYAHATSLLSWWTARVKQAIAERDGWIYHYSTHRQWMLSKFLHASIK